MATPRAKKQAVCFGVAAIIVLALIVWISANWIGEAAEGDGTVPELASDEVTPVADSLAEMGFDRPMGMAERSVLDQHFAALGGFNAISSVSSLRFSGKVTFAGGITQQVVAVKKNHDRMRVTVRNNVVQVSICISPEDNWRARWERGQLVMVEDLPPEEVEKQGWYIYMVSELFLAMQRGWDFEYLGVRDFNYKMAHVFEVRPHPRHSIRFYLDPETFLDVGREDRIFEKDGTLSITRRYYSGHFEAGSMMMPGKLEVFLNGEKTQDVELEQGEVNPGILGNFFDRPVMESTPERTSGEPG
jgi:hypothetical protein